MKGHDMLPEIEQLGLSLPPGWQRPSRGLVEAFRGFLKEGLAPPSARHLYQDAEPMTEEEAWHHTQVRRGIEMLKAYVDPRSASSLTAVGMAYPQLDQACSMSVRILVANIGMPDLRSTSRQPSVRMFFDPVITPIEGAGFQDRIEYCFSVPGVGTIVRRWKAVMVQLSGQAAFRMDDVDAWILQHEVDHLDGITCATRALEQGRELYYVPQEWQRTFVEFPNYDQWPYRFPEAQLQAMISGEFDLAKYAL
jgi:peptide deformylase